MEKWYKSEGENILKQIGIKKGQKILDFGCGSGVYSIIASKIVGLSGKIYALDKNGEKITELKRKINSLKIKNIEIIETTGEIPVPLENNSLNVILIYDVFHLLNKENRYVFLQEVNRLLKIGGFLSYYITHTKEYDIDLEEVNNQLINNNIVFKRKLQVPMVHWGSIEDGLIFNYYKI